MLLRTARASSNLWRTSSSPIPSLALTRGLRTPPRSRKDTNAPSPADARLPQPSHSQPESNQPATPPSTTNKDVSSMLSSIDPSENQLLAPVHIPEDPKAVLRSDHPAASLLAQSGLVVTRQIEMMNIFIGFEQASKYIIMDPQGSHVGYMAETDGGVGTGMTRQMLRTHRAFTTNIFDKYGQEVLRFQRPFSLVNTRIRVYDALEVGKYPPRNDNVKSLSTDVKDLGGDQAQILSTLPIEAMRVIGEAHSEWAPLRRKYNLYLAHELEGIGTGSIDNVPIPGDLSAQQQSEITTKKQVGNFAQFASVNEPFLSWDFTLKGADDQVLGSVNRQFRGFGREIFTDTGMYVLRMDSAASGDASADQSQPVDRAYSETLDGADKRGMTLDQRAVMLATAVTLDFDYFSRHSSNSGGMMWMPLWMGGGGGGAAGAEAGAEAGGVVVGGAAGRGVAGAASEIGAGEGAIAGAGSLAGYEAMQRGMGRGDDANPVSSQAEPPSSDASPYDSGSPQAPQDGWGGQQDGGDAWGSGDADPWSDKLGGSGSGGGEGGSSWWETLKDAFFDS